MNEANVTLEAAESMNQSTNIRQITQNSQKPTQFDSLKWIFVSLLIIGGIVANTYFHNVAWALRLSAGLVLIVVALLVALQTTLGRTFWLFAMGARIELRKVVWPTRQETIQTTLVIVAMVVVTALILWGLDTLFFWLVGWLAGQRG